MVHVVVLAHGSRDPRHAATMGSIADTLHERSLRATVSAAYLEFCEPTLAEAVADLPADETVLAVPMLLTSAFHARVDVPAAVAAAHEARPDLTLRVSDVLGPAPGLIAAMERRVEFTGADLDADGTATVMIAAGSSEDTARLQVAVVADDWLQPPRRGTHAFASGPGPSVDEAVRALVDSGARRIVVAQYLLAPGVLPDRAVADARGTCAELGVEVAVAEVLGTADEVLALIAERARGAGS